MNFDIVWITWGMCSALLIGVLGAWTWLVKSIAHALVLIMWARLRNGR